MNKNTRFIFTTRRHDLFRFSAKYCKFYHHRDIYYKHFRKLPRDPPARTCPASLPFTKHRAIHASNDDSHALLHPFSLYHRRDIVSERLIKSRSFLADLSPKHWSMSRIPARRRRSPIAEIRYSLAKSKISERDARTRCSSIRFSMQAAPRTTVLVTSRGKLRRR